jgi:hypothetical protein
MLLPDVTTVESIIRDDEAPRLALLPVVAGALFVLAMLFIAGTYVDTSAKIALSLLLGPPFALFHNWWLTICLRLLQKCCRGKSPRSVFVCLAGWSWLPVIYLSIVSSCVAQLVVGKVSAVLLGCAVCWQIVLSVIALRRLENFGLVATISFCVLLALLSLLPAAVFLTTLGFLYKGVL